MELNEQQQEVLKELLAEEILGNISETNRQVYLQILTKLENEQDK